MIITTCRYLIAISFLLSLFFVACERVVEDFSQEGAAYYPITKNKYRIYQIDSTVYNEYSCVVQKSSYQIKEVTGNPTRDGEGQTAYRVERYKREELTEPWTLEGVWSEKIEGNQVQRVEDNQRFVKMVFPVKSTQEWDGITYIRRDTLVPIRGGTIDLYKDWGMFVYKNVGQSYLDTISNSIYQNTAQVIQVDKTNNIERRYSTEVYAYGIGLVYKEMRILDSQCRVPRCTGQSDIANCLTVPWETKAEKGYILTQSLVEHNY